MSDFEAQFEQPIQETAEQVVQLYETSEEEENAFVSALVYNQKDIPENLSLKAIYSSVHQKFSHDPLLNSKDPYSEESSTIETRISRGPIQLVKVNDNGTFEVCKQGAELLKSIKSKIGVVSIGGPSRCGKSFIMNLLSNGSGAGFEVGSRVAACTQGIWIWGDPIQTPDMCIIFLDSEGCKSIEKSATHDAKIFALLILLSSVFIYNSKGVIDEQAVNQLSLATCISEIISTKASSYDTDEDMKGRLAALSPKFIWLLRDFHLSLVDEDNTPISARQYMENVLGMKNNFGRNPEKYNKIRQAILEIFLERDCITLPRPLDQESQLENLTDYDLTALRPKFIKNFEKLQLSALEHCPPKKFEGIEVAGHNLLHFLTELIKAINSGIVPNINSTWSHVIKSQYEDLLKDAKKRYIKARDVEIQNMPYEEGDLLLKLQTAKDRTLVILREVQLRDEALEEEVREKFDGFYDDDITMTLKANLVASEAYNLSLIERVFRNILIDLDQGKYFDSFDLLEKDWNVAIKKYENEAKGPGKFIALSEFSRKHQHHAFARCFQDIVDKYDKEVTELRKRHKEYEEKLFNTRKRDDKETKQLLLEHIHHLESELGIIIDEREQLGDILGRVQYEIGKAIKKKKKEEALEEERSRTRKWNDEINSDDVKIEVLDKPTKKSNTKSCGCITF